MNFRFFKSFALISFTFILLIDSSFAFTPPGKSEISSTAAPYTRFRPQWGLELTGAALSDRELTQLQTNEKHSMYSFGAQWEFQPRFIQTIGVLGAGVSLAAHPAQIPNGQNKSNLVFAWSLGAQIRYQARFFENQFLVPMVAYSSEVLSYQFRNGNSGKSGRFMTRGPVFGAWLYLNALDSSNSRSLFYDYGIARTYLVFEMKTMTGQDSVASLDGRTYYAGLRFEY